MKLGIIQIPSESSSIELKRYMVWLACLERRQSFFIVEVIKGG
ncbi:MAG: hypothetical protein ACTSWP_01370 [Candidatus Freyarchaeota archaeon]|nr:hypothetical protein [Candidatus Freyrarchaeum guaymaensis]